MKKIGLLFSAMVILSMLLAACGVASTDSGEGSLGTDTGLPGTGGEFTQSPDTGSALGTPTTDLGGVEATATEAGSALTTEMPGTAAAPTSMATASPATTEAPMTTASPEATSSAGEPGALPNTGASAVDRLSNILDYTVQDATGKDIGTVEDAVVNLSTACTEYVLINSDLAVDRLVAVPWWMLDVRPDAAGANSFVLAADSTQLESAPGFARDALPDLNTPGWDANLLDFWGGVNRINPSSASGAGAATSPSATEAVTGTETVTGTGVVSGSIVTGTGPMNFTQAGTQCATLWPAGAQPMGSTGSDMGSTSGSDMSAQTTPSATETVTGTMTTPGATTGNNRILASDLIGLNVQSDAADSLGEVQDALVELQSGAVRYLIVSAGGFLGIGEKQIPVPVNLLSLNADSSYVNFALGQDVLTNAPNFDLSSLPDFATSSWDLQFNSYWMDYNRNSGSDMGSGSGGSGYGSPSATAAP